MKIDNSRVEGGSLEDDWDFLPPKEIPDPEAKKPEDWDDRAKIDDPDATKPEVCTYVNRIQCSCFTVPRAINGGCSTRLKRYNVMQDCVCYCFFLG